MKQIVLDDLTVNIVKSSRRKTMAIKIINNTAYIHIPSKLPLSLAKVFVKKKTEWIRTKLLEQSTKKPVIKYFIDGENFLFLGQQYPLNLIDSETKPNVSLTNTALNYASKPAQQQTNKIESMLTAWYRKQATDYLTNRTREISAQTRLNAGVITVKAYQARWGSCTPKGDIQYNWKLIFAPPQIIDYVIIHELCHTRHHNHSPAFWSLVAEFAPDYKSARNWLKQNGHSLEL